MSDDERHTPGAEASRPRKIVVKGTSGAGKSTVAADLARRLALPHIELDALYHGPNWSEPTAEVFQARVQAAMAANPAGWVIDGNYGSKLGETVVAEADTIVWLDLPFGVKLRRLWHRTRHQIGGKVELWNGNRETWRGVVLARDSLFVWMVRTHLQHRRAWPAHFGNDPRLVRLRSEAEVRRWVDEHTPGDLLEGEGAHGW